MKGVDLLSVLAVAVLVMAAGCICVIAYRATHEQPVAAEVIHR